MRKLRRGLQPGLAKDLGKPGAGQACSELSSFEATGPPLWVPHSQRPCLGRGPGKPDRQDLHTILKVSHSCQSLPGERLGRHAPLWPGDFDVVRSLGFLKQGRNSSSHRWEGWERQQWQSGWFSLCGRAGTREDPAVLGPCLLAEMEDLGAGRGPSGQGNASESSLSQAVASGHLVQGKF